MHCIKCGTLAAPGAQFCFKCGAPIVGETTATATAAATAAPAPTTPEPKKPAAAWLYLVGALLVGVNAAEFIPALNDEPASPAAGVSSWLWTGLFFYLWWKRKGKKGWHGFLIGALVGVVIFMLAAFIRGYLHALHAGAGG